MCVTKITFVFDGFSPNVHDRIWLNVIVACISVVCPSQAEVTTIVTHTNTPANTTRLHQSLHLIELLSPSMVSRTIRTWAETMIKRKWSKEKKCRTQKTHLMRTIELCKTSGSSFTRGSWILNHVCRLMFCFVFFFFLFGRLLLFCRLPHFSNAHKQ